VSGGYALNDLFDLESDRVAKPSRPIPSETLSPGMATAVAINCFLIGLLLLLLTSFEVAGYMAMLALGLVLYAWKLSRLLIVSNLTVALLTSSVFILSALISEPDSQGWNFLIIAILFSFLHHLGREIIKDIEDLEGDKSICRDTLATAWGPQRAATAAAGVFVILLLSIYAVYWVMDLTVAFIIVATLGVVFPLLVISYVMTFRDVRKNISAYTLLTKLTMLPGLLALLLAR
jgi:4-hydroxybenzoate polyprenyltransferase